MAADRSPAVKLPARAAFDLNMADADMLVSLAKLLRNQRANRMRKELRERLGGALRVPRRDWARLECLENDEVFVTFKPGAGHWRTSLNDDALKPLLRQAIVAACAAVETFVADRAVEHLGPVLRGSEKPPRLLGLNMTVADWLRIESQYRRRKWGLRQIIELEIREKASPTPTVIGEIFSMVGIRDVLKRCDVERRVAKGKTAEQLEALRQRRNKIAHEGDRRGRGRAPITVKEVEDYLADIRSIIGAMDLVTAPSVVRRSAAKSSPKAHVGQLGTGLPNGHT